MQTLNNNTATIADQVPLESYSLPQAHPDRLATLAKLFGLNSPAVDKCKVLQIGSAIGSNLIPLATAYPDSHFVGVELSKRQSTDEQALVKTLGLKNVEIKHTDILDIDKDFGKFDYIIIHGVYSWVPKNLQEKILQICSKNLSRHGVAYVSYNTYPGWHHRGMIRDMMLYHTAQFEDIGAKALQARALLDFLSQSVPTENNAYGIMLRNELDLLRQQSDSYLLSDHLKNENEPVYFHRFAEQAAENELQYLAEAEFSSMPTSNFAPEVADTLRRISNDIIRTEQYMDFVRNRAFRQTLLCHKDAKLNRNLDWKSMTHFRFATPAKTTAQENQLQNNEQIQFSLPNGVTLNTTNPLIKLAFSHLSNIWPRSASFEELVSAAASKLTAAEKGTRQMQEQVLGADLLIAYAAGVLVVRGTEPKLVLESSERPAVHEFTRHQAKTGIRITNQLHEPVDADVFVRNVLILLDGTRELSAILDELEKLVEQGALNVQKDGRQLAKGQELRDTLKVVAEESLAKIAQAGLLIA